MKNAVIIPNIPENIVSLKISIPICFSDSGIFATNNLIKVIGAWFSEVDFNFQSSVCAVGFLICLCSTIFFTLERKRKLLMTAGTVSYTHLTLPTICSV